MVSCCKSGAIKILAGLIRLFDFHLRKDGVAKDDTFYDLYARKSFEWGGAGDVDSWTRRLNYSWKFRTPFPRPSTHKDVVMSLL